MSNSDPPKPTIETKWTLYICPVCGRQQNSSVVVIDER